MTIEAYLGENMKQGIGDNLNKQFGSTSLKKEPWDITKRKWSFKTYETTPNNNLHVLINFPKFIQISDM